MNATYDRGSSTPRMFHRVLIGILGMGLVADALTLMCMGLFNFGVILPLAMGLALVAWAWKVGCLRAWLEADARRRLAWRAICGLVWVGLFGVAGFFVQLARISTSVVDESPPRAVLILGSGTPYCKPSPALAARLDQGAEIAARWPQALIVVTGGPDWGHHCTEGQVMGDYLRKRGLPDKRIVQEEISTSTHENLLFSQVILSDHGWQHHETIALVTSDFHTLRAGRIAARLGYQQVQLIGVPTPLYLRYNAWLREAFAFLSGVVLGEM